MEEVTTTRRSLRTSLNGYACFLSAFAGGVEVKFKRGQSGNPRGKVKGTLHKATRAALAQLEGDLEAIARKCIDKAKDGDLIAVKLILDKLMPNAKERHLSINWPQLEGAANIPVAMTVVLEAVGKGELTAGEG